MSILASLILGALQALTEFFPVSSSTHLYLAKLLLGVESSEQNGVLLDLSCHLGSLVALVFYLRKDIHCIFRHEPRKLLLFFLALLPLIPLYLLLKPCKEALSSTTMMGFFLLGTGGILLAGQFFSMRRSEKEETMRKKVQDVLLIGAVQSMALLPGISRSASTISCARILGWTPKEAVRFSFLLSIPTILGGNFLEFLRISSKSPIPWAPLSTAFAVSFLLSLLVIRKAFTWLEKGDFRLCALYCVLLGLGIIFFLGHHG